MIGSRAPAYIRCVVYHTTNRIFNQVLALQPLHIVKSKPVKAPIRKTTSSSNVELAAASPDGEDVLFMTYWTRVAVGLSIFSLCWEMIEGGVSVHFGFQEGNVSLWEVHYHFWCTVDLLFYYA
jgi:hypothetical protein